MDHEKPLIKNWLCLERQPQSGYLGLTEVENVTPEIPDVLDPVNQLFRFSYLYVLWLKIKTYHSEMSCLWDKLRILMQIFLATGNNKYIFR